MKITFIIKSEHIKMDVNENDNIFKIKEELIKTFYENRSDLWLIFKFVNEKPLREFGKQDLIPGDIPLTLDHKRLSHFSIRDEFEYIFEVNELIKPPMKQMKILKNDHIKIKKNIFDLTNETDFPKLQ